MKSMLREIPIADLLQIVKKAGELYAKAELPIGDSDPDSGAIRSGCSPRPPDLPEQICRFNMEKNQFVLGNMGENSRLA